MCRVVNVKSMLVWQRRFWEHLIDNEEDWKRHLDYIHYNPVKHGYASLPRNLGILDASPLYSHR